MLLPISPASAHSELLESTPAEGAELSKAPTEVQLVFGEPVQQEGSSIVVDVRDTTVSQAKTFATNGNVASVQLTGPGQPGTYTVNFRVVSEDGHVVSDSFEYEVIDAASQSATSDPTQTPTDDQSSARRDRTHPPTVQRTRTPPSSGSWVWGRSASSWSSP